MPAAETIEELDLEDLLNDEDGPQHFIKGHTTCLLAAPPGSIQQACCGTLFRIRGQFVADSQMQRDICKPCRDYAKIDKHCSICGGTYRI